MNAISNRKRTARLAIAGLAVFLCLTPPGRADSRPVADRDLGIRISSLPREEVPGPSKKSGTYTARILIATAVRSRPGGGRVVWRARGTSRWSGTAKRLMVLSSRQVGTKTWLKVRLPIRPNRSSGWIPRDRVRLEQSRRFIHIDLSRRLLRVYARGKVVVRFRVVVGAPATPTPRGLFAVYDKVRQGNPNGFIGPWALPLTAHSRQLKRFDGGPGVVALHGRGRKSLGDPLGSARSHGCIRMNNSRIRALARLEKGTAVQIRR
jgi:lipoprotein-anchoring transpeptidase ErfK/SrfK